MKKSIHFTLVSILLLLSWNVLAQVRVQPNIAKALQDKSDKSFQVAPAAPKPTSSNSEREDAISTFKDIYQIISNPRFDFLGEGRNSLTEILLILGVSKETLTDARSQLDDNKKDLDNGLEIFKNFAGLNKDVKVDAANDAALSFVITKLLEPKKKVELVELKARPDIKERLNFKDIMKLRESPKQSDSK